LHQVIAGLDIPLGARILAVADAFDAMTSDRPYRQAIPEKEAWREIRDVPNSIRSVNRYRFSENSAFRYPGER